LAATSVRFGMAQGRSVKNRCRPSSRRARIRCMNKILTNSSRTTTMTRVSGWFAGVVVVTSAFLYVAAAQTPGTDMNHAPGILPSGLGDSVDRDVAAVRDATARFKTSEAAEAAGYKRVTECVEYQPAGAMGYHFQNNTLLDTTLDVSHPEVLVYEKKPDGTFKLNGVEFLVPISAWTSTEPPRIMGQALKKADRLGIWYLHVWTWEPSPSGLFADWNPNVKCGGGLSKHKSASSPAKRGKPQANGGRSVASRFPT